MNEMIQSLLDRKSVRVFEDREIPEEAVQEILLAAVNAPTAGNQQLYTILRITDDEIKKQLADSCDHQPFIASGKLVLVFCADCLKWFHAFRAGNCDPRTPGVGDLLLAVDDAVIAAQNAVVAAESMGIGSCYIGDIMENYETQKDILGLPRYVFPAALLVFGYPTEQQKNRAKPVRAKMEYIVQENRYHSHTDAELRDMLMKNATPETFDGWLSAFCKRKYNSDFSREMTRSVSEFLKEYQDNTNR